MSNEKQTKYAVRGLDGSIITDANKGSINEGKEVLYDTYEKAKEELEVARAIFPDEEFKIVEVN